MLRDFAIAAGLSGLKTSFSRSSASRCLVALPDQYDLDFTAIVTLLRTYRETDACWESLEAPWTCGATAGLTCAGEMMLWIRVSAPVPLELAPQSS